MLNLIETLKGISTFTLLCTVLFGLSASGLSREVRSQPMKAQNTTDSSNFSNLEDCNRGSKNNDEPPIGVGRGSFYLDVPEGTKIRKVGKKKYQLQSIGHAKYSVNEYHSFIDAVAVLTEHKSGSIKFRVVCHEKIGKDKKSSNLTLHLWLGLDPSKPNETKDEIVISGENGGTIRMTAGKLPKKGKDIPKKRRPFRYRYKKSRLFFSKSKSFVVKWKICKGISEYGKCSETVANGEGDEMYRFYIRLGHSKKKTR